MKKMLVLLTIAVSVNAHANDTEAFCKSVLEIRKTVMDSKEVLDVDKTVTSLEKGSEAYNNIQNSQMLTDKAITEINYLLGTKCNL